MIKVLVKQNNNQIVNLSITGHADSGEYGKDFSLCWCFYCWYWSNEYACKKRILSLKA